MSGHSTSRLNLLFLSTRTPWPADDGGNIAILEPVRLLARRGHQITLLTFGDRTADHHPELSRIAEVVMIRHVKPHGIPRAMISLARPQPYSVLRYRDGRFLDQLNRLLTSRPFDLVQCEHLHMAGYFPAIEKHGIPKVLREQNILSVLMNRFATHGSWWKRVWAATQSGKIRRFETSAFARADINLAISPVDAGHIRRTSPAARIEVVPAGVDLERFRPRAAGSGSMTVMFTGSLEWAMNIDGVEWFVRQIWPEIIRKRPDARFLIVGKNPPAAIRQFGSQDSITVTGTVPDIRDWIAQAAVCVVPLRMGSGIRLKILEALAMGKAVVSTSIGAEGIPVEDGVEIRLADTPGAFSGAVTELLADPALRERMGRQGRRMVETGYGWPRLVDRLETVYSQLLSRRGTGLAAGAGSTWQAGGLTAGSIPGNFLSTRFSG